MERVYSEVAEIDRRTDTDTDTVILAPRLYHSLCGETVVFAQTFDGMRRYEDWIQSCSGKRAMDRLRSAAEGVAPSLFRLFHRD